MLIVLFVPHSVDIHEGFALILILAVVYNLQVQMLLMKPDIRNKKQAWPMGLMEMPAVSSKDLKRMLKQYFNVGRHRFLN